MLLHCGTSDERVTHCNRNGRRREGPDVVIRKMCVVIHLRRIRAAPQATNLGKGDAGALPLHPSRCGADQALSLPAPSKRPPFHRA